MQWRKERKGSDAIWRRSGNGISASRTPPRLPASKSLRFQGASNLRRVPRDIVAGLPVKKGVSIYEQFRALAGQRVTLHRVNKVRSRGPFPLPSTLFSWSLLLLFVFAWLRCHAATPFSHLRPPTTTSSAPPRFAFSCSRSSGSLYRRPRRPNRDRRHNRPDTRKLFSPERTHPEEPPSFFLAILLRRSSI